MTPQSPPVAEPKFKVGDVDAARLPTGAPGECWLWTGRTKPPGYGALQTGPLGARRTVFAHRFAWEVANGPIPAGMFVCHSCDVPLCCNPAHLFLGTQADNMADMDRKGRRYPPPPCRFKGQDQNNAKLCNAEVLEIRASREPLRTLAERYGVSGATISRVRLGQSYVNVTEGPQ